MNHNSEKWLEPELVRRVEKVGGRCTKFESPGSKGVPDRIVWLPRGRCILVEVKTLGEEPNPLQRWWHRQFLDLGFEVWVIDSEEVLNTFSSGVLQAL